MFLLTTVTLSCSLRISTRFDHVSKPWFVIIESAACFAISEQPLNTCNHHEHGAFDAQVMQMPQVLNYVNWQIAS